MASKSGRRVLFARLENRGVMLEGVHVVQIMMLGTGSEMRTQKGETEIGNL